MFRRCTVLLVVLSALVVGCGSDAEVPATTAPAAPSTTVARTTTTAPTTTAPATTTRPPMPDAADLVAPTDVLDGFRFTATALDDDAEAGLVSAGMFVAPDAVQCAIGNPAWMYPTLGTITAIGDIAWWEDSMGARSPEPRSEQLGEPGEVCAGAVEFWDLPLMAAGVLALGDEAGSDEIEGYAVTVFTLISLDPQVVLDQASLWVTEEGWPIKMEVHGTAPGGVMGVRGLEPEDPTTPKAFALGFELTDINEGSLMVRSPDGSVVAGPIGEVVSSLPEFAAPSPELQAAIDEARGQGCAATNLPLSILEPLGLEAGLGQFSVVSSSPAIEGTIQQTTGTFMPPDPADRVVTSAADDPTRFAHADLVFAQMAPMVWVFTSFQGLTSPFAVDANGRLDFAVWAGTAEDASRVATWDGETVRYADGTTAEVASVDLLHRNTTGVTLTDPAVAEAWDRVDAFATAALEAARSVATGDPQALADLRAIDSQLDDWNALGCALLGHAWTTTENWIQSGGDSGGTLELYVAEAKAESLLLLFDYLEVMVSYLERPEVDWLEADGVVLEDTWVPDDSAGEYLSVIGRAAEGASWMMLFFTM